jgi:hypothetical protein
MSRKHKEYWQSIGGQRQPKGFLKKLPAQKKAGELLKLSRNQRRTLRGLLTGHLCERTSIGTGLVNSPSVIDASRNVTVHARENFVLPLLLVIESR